MPEATSCLYHGEEKQNGPRSLKDMMDFGSDADGMSRFFKDYPLVSTRSRMKAAY